VEDSKRNLEFITLKENVLEKIEIAKENDLFEIKDIESYDLDGLKGYYTYLIEKYVSLNPDRVIEDCYFNLKLDGIYSNNELLADELIEKAQDALNVKDYDELFDIVNLLYELDERTDK